MLVMFRTQSLLQSLKHSLHSIKIDICKEGRQVRSNVGWIFRRWVDNESFIRKQQ